MILCPTSLSFVDHVHMCSICTKFDVLHMGYDSVRPSTFVLFLSLFGKSVLVFVTVSFLFYHPLYPFHKSYVHMYVLSLCNI